MNVTDGAISFKGELDNEQMHRMIEETERRIKGLSNATVKGGKMMDNTFDAVEQSIRDSLGKIGEACYTHERQLEKLRAEYDKLGIEARQALSQGDKQGASKIHQRQLAIEGEVKLRKMLLKEAREASDALEIQSSKLTENRNKAEENANAHQTLRSRIRELTEQMATYRESFGDQTEEYRRMSAELGRLKDIQADVTRQGRILSNDQAGFQGIISGLSGIAGGFSAATGAISLFAGENEDLQKVMAKVQSVMAITIGLQQVSQTLNKDSAFQLVTLNGLKEWWAGIVAKATIAETAETAATMANTVAQQAQATATAQNTVVQGANTVVTGAQTAAATAGTVANFTLAGAFRAVGLAIKSIPVFGWVLAGISALIALVSHFSSKAREAKKAQEEFSKAMIEGCYKPIGKVEELSVKYNALGDNIKEKEKFIKDNKKAFEELGVSVTNVRDAENLLINNKEAFISAQIAKAKATILIEKAMEKQREALANREEFKSLSVGEKSGRIKLGWTGFYSPAKELNDKHAKLEKERDEYFEQAMQQEVEGFEKLKQAGIKGAKEYEKGTVGAIKQAISEKQEALNDLAPNSEKWKQTHKEIEALQKELEKPTSAGKPTSKSGDKDPFIEQLEKRKAQYAEYAKWQNSTNEEVRKNRSAEFAELVKSGNSYKEFLERLQAEISKEPQRNHTREHLSAIRNELAELQNTSVLDVFNESLRNELDKAADTLAKLNIVYKTRNKIKEDNEVVGLNGSEIENEQLEILTNFEKEALKEISEEYRKAQQEYQEYLDGKLKDTERYIKDKRALEGKMKKAETPTEKQAIQMQIDTLDTRFVSMQEKMYDELVQEHRSFEQKRKDISAEYDEQIILAREKKNKDLEERLAKAKKEALSKLAIEEMRQNPEWEKLFSNLDDLTIDELEKILTNIDGKTGYLGIEFNPKDLEAINEHIQRVKKEIRERNPFKALIGAVKDYGKAAGDEQKKSSIKNMLNATAESTALVRDGFNAIVGGIKQLGIEMDEETNQIINDIGEIMDGASRLAQGIASGNPLSIIQGSIGLLTSAISLFNSKDRSATRKIKEHQELLINLQNAYSDLEKAVEKALGSGRYEVAKRQIENLKKQQEEYAKMIEAERSKKKSDKEKIKEYEQKHKEAGGKIVEVLDNIRDSIMGVTAASAAEQLGNAFIDAFSKGEDAIKAFGKTADEIVANIIKKMLIQQLLEKPLGAIIGKYSKKWFDDNGNFLGFGEIGEDAKKLGDEIKGLANGFNEKGKVILDSLMNQLGGLDSSNALSGAIKGVSEETASIVAGQLNAMRINQGEATSILRGQLSSLNQIAMNTSYTRLLVDILAVMKSSKTNSLRSQGHTNLHI